MKRIAWVAALTLLAGCNEELDLGRVEGLLELPEYIDFGDVQIGVTASETLTLQNKGTGAVVVARFKAGPELSGSAYQFILPQDGLTVSAGRSEEVSVRFQPFQASETPYSVVVTLELADGTTATVELRGRGVDSGLEITPNPLDFGTVLVGTARTLELTLTNRLSEAVVLRSKDHAGGKATAISSSGNGTFELDVAVNANGALLDGALLAPGATITVPVTYRPDPSDLSGQDRARWTLANCEYPLCEVQVDLRGKGTTSALQCDPAGLVFGPIPPNQTQTLAATCTNVATDDIEILSWSLEPGTAGEFQLPGGSRPQTLAPGASVDVEVSFTPTQTTWDTAAMPAGQLAVASRHAQGGVLDPVLVSLAGRAGGPTIVVTPAALHFGDIAVGTSHAKLLLVENRGLEPLLVSQVDGDVAGLGAFTTDATAFTLDPGASTVVTARFAPQTAGMLSSQIRFHSNDALNPQLDVPVEGRGLTLPPCAYQITPTSLLFGAVPFSRTAVQGVRISNVGNDPCLINDLDITPTTFGATTAFTLVNGPQSGVMLAAGAALDVPVEYAPVTPGGDRAHLTWYISDPANPNPSVLLYGVGEPLVQVQCPAPITTQAGVPVTLSAMGLALGANITGYTWAITNAPVGGIGTPNQWLPAPPTAATETFLPYIVGVYDIQVTITDDLGRMAGCTTQVTAEGEGLQVTMTWNGPGDVDLHVHNGTAGSPWFDGLNDCYYGNTTPVWDSAFPTSTGPNPELDFDNTSANGPENTRILVPEVGRTYTIGAHNFSNAAGRIVTIDVYCGGVLPQQTFTSAPLNGSTAGNCTANDFWKVAQVTFTSQNTCTIVPLNTVVASSVACTAF
jgi:hypothetical protein